MRVAWVVPRYGAEVGGGAEEYVRAVAEHLRDSVELTVLTTCALDYQTWADYYPAGETELNGVRVLRFPVPEPRDMASFDRLTPTAFRRSHDLDLGRRWMRLQGPHSPDLLEHLRTHGGDYDIACFSPYLYASTAEGIDLLADRAVLHPCAHDEPALRMHIFDSVFAAARALVFNAPEERRLVEARFGTDDRPRFIVSLAVDPPPSSDPMRFRRAFGVVSRYLLCLGRIEPAKGSDVLIERFREARGRFPDLSLVLMGRPHMEIPDAPGLVVTGFVDEQTKHDALAGAAVVVLPSAYESLSIVALEAWAHGRPTLANAEAEVLVGQASRSNGGLWYRTPREFHATLGILLDQRPLAETLGLQGRRWVEASGGWERVCSQWLEALAAAARPTAVPASRL